MEQIDRINKIIQQFLDSKGDYSYLKPIIHIDRGYGVCRKFGFDPTDGKFKSYDAPSQFKDDSERIKFIKKLNQDITNYNEKIDISQHPEIDSFPYYSFLVIRDGYELVDKILSVEIHDELLYEHIQDEDFVPRFNKTIYDFLKYKKEELEAEGRWSNDNIFYKPFQAFGDWFDKHPEHLLAPPYEIEGGVINVTDALWSIADDLRARIDKGEFPTYRDAYKWWCKHHTHKGKNVTWESF